MAHREPLLYLLFPIPGVEGGQCQQGGGLMGEGRHVQLLTPKERGLYLTAHSLCAIKRSFHFHGILGQSMAQFQICLPRPSYFSLVHLPGLLPSPYSIPHMATRGIF